MPKKPMRLPGNTPGEEYLQARYERLTLRLNKVVYAKLEELADKAGMKVTQYLTELICEKGHIPVPQDRRRKD